MVFFANVKDEAFTLMLFFLCSDLFPERELQKKESMVCFLLSFFALPRVTMRLAVLEI